MPLTPDLGGQFLAQQSLLDLRDSPEAMAALFQDELARSFELATHHAGLESPQAQFALGVVGATKHVLSPIVRDPRLPNSLFVQATGGPDGNEHREIDTVGGYFLNTALEHHDRYAPWATDTLVFIEEDGAYKRVNWHLAPEKKQRPKHTIIQDPCDGTTNATDGNYTLATAVTVLDELYGFQAAAIASLTTNTVLVVEGHTPHLYNYDHYPQPVALPQLSDEIPNPLRIATLDRRVAALRKAGFLYADEGLTLHTFGGHAALALYLGQIHAMFDFIPGQPLYEAAHWGLALSQIPGIWVADHNGFPIDYPDLIKQSQETGKMPRVSIIIARNEAIGRVFVNRQLPLAV